MSNRALFSFLLPVVLCLPAQPAGAYTVLGSGNDITHWSGNSITWYLQSAGSSDVSFTQLQAATTAAFQQFQQISCFNKTFAYGGKKSSDPENGIFIKFQESNWDPTVGDAAAYAQTWTSWDGAANNSIIVFNGQDIEWTTTEADDFFSVKSDIQGVATHELGHCLGLGHSRVRAATMFFSGGTAELRSLDQDDKNGVCFIYDNFTQGQPCDECKSDNNCASGYCLTYSDDEQYCGKDCTSDASCPDNFYCYDIQGGQDQCAAMNGYCNQAGQNSPIGYFCYGHEVCESGLCMVLPDTAYCSAECTQDSQCPSPTKCIAGLCLQGGSTSLGGSCSYHTDCQSGMCLGMSDTEAVCTINCEVMSDCPGGFGCSMGYCLQSGGKAYGAACDYAMECDSISCFSVGGGQKICTEMCDADDDCPGNDPCTFSICIPPGSEAFGEECEIHTDCKSGYCAGMSSKFCSTVCESAGDCEGTAVCGSGGYCVPQQTPTDQCFAHSNCESSQFCKQPAEGAAGSCVPMCNPYADLGCDEWHRCKWHFIVWADEVKGECVAENMGGESGQTCDPASDPCQPDFVCVNVGGEGMKCHKDCNATTDNGCSSVESCLGLNASADPHHGVCVCSDASCMGEDPVEDVVVQPTQDVAVPPVEDTAGSDDPPDDVTADPGGGGGTEAPGGGGDGCSTSGGGTAPALPLLLALFGCCVGALRRRRAV